MACIVPGAPIRGAGHSHRKAIQWRSRSKTSGRLTARIRPWAAVTSWRSTRGHIGARNHRRRVRLRGCPGVAPHQDHVSALWMGRARPMEILASQIAVMMEVQFKSGIHSDRIAQSVLPTSGRPRWCGIATLVNPSTTPSCGNAAVPPASPTPSSPRVCRTPFGARRDSCPIRTSRVPRSSGSSTTSMAPAPLPMRES